MPPNSALKVSLEATLRIVSSALKSSILALHREHPNDGYSLKLSSEPRAIDPAGPPTM